MDDSNKINGTKVAKRATAPTTKPSAASPDTQNHPVGGKKTMGESEHDEEQLEDEIIAEEDQIDFSEDINALFEGNDQLSEEFKQKAATIFEARVLDRVQQIQEDLESQYASILEETVAEIQNDLSEKEKDSLFTKAQIRNFSRL